MKKSTLITTIAMIVVVVVALSTATYAWFSSATTSTAVTTITTKATVGWALSQGTIGGNNVISWSSSADTIELKTQGLTEGLFSPNEALANKPSSNAATSVSVTSASDKFYACNVSGTDAYVTTVNTAKTPTTIRVVNNNSSAAKCIITVLVVLNEDNSNTRYAASAMTFYFASATTTYTLGYTYCDATSITTATSVTAMANLEDDAVKVTKVDQTKKSTVAKSNAKGTQPAYDNATAVGQGFLKNKTGSEITINDAVKIGTDQAYLVYTFETESIAVANGINFVNYTWMDGWVANDAAGAATVSTYYIFGASVSDATSKGTADPTAA